MRKSILAALFCGYVLALLDVTLLRYPQPGPPSNWMPLATIRHYCQTGGWNAVMNLAGNIALFIPLGLILPTLDRAFRSAAAGAALSFSVSLMIEIFQYASGHRVADVDDVLLNTTGGCLGYAAFVFGRAMKTRMISSPDSCTNRSVC